MSEKCPVSGLPITRNPDWEFETEDGTYSCLFYLIGDDILFHRGSGVLNVVGMKQYMATVESIIDTHFNDGKKFYEISDLSGAKGFDFATRKPYVKWGETIAKQMHSSLYYNVSFTMRTIIKIGKTFSSNFDMMDVVDSYEEGINRFIAHKSQFNGQDRIDHEDRLNSEILSPSEDIDKPLGKKDLERIDELILYLGKMSWLEEFAQKIPKLPQEDPFAELFAVVASIQDDLGEMYQRKEMEKLLVQKEKLILEQNQSFILEKIKTEELRTLRFQLKPHFLYNVLNSLHYLIGNAPDKAQEMTLHLARYFQHILSEDVSETVKLNNEISLIEEYIELQKIRFEDRLASEISCPDSLMNHDIPGLIIFPLIENAVKYGYATYDGVCNINLSVNKVNSTLMIIVENDGKWVEEDPMKTDPRIAAYGGGIGLENIRKRLMHHYEDSWSLEHKEDSGKVFVTLTIPFE